MSIRLYKKLKGIGIEDILSLSQTDLKAIFLKAELTESEKYVLDIIQRGLWKWPHKWLRVAERNILKFRVLGSDTAKAEKGGFILCFRDMILSFIELLHNPSDRDLMRHRLLSVPVKKTLASIGASYGLTCEAVRIREKRLYQKIRDLLDCQVLFRPFCSANQEMLRTITDARDIMYAFPVLTQEGLHDLFEKRFGITNHFGYQPFLNLLLEVWNIRIRKWQNAPIYFIDENIDLRKLMKIRNMVNGYQKQNPEVLSVHEVKKYVHDTLRDPAVSDHIIEIACRFSGSVKAPAKIKVVIPRKNVIMRHLIYQILLENNHPLAIKEILKKMRRRIRESEEFRKFKLPRNTAYMFKDTRFVRLGRSGYLALSEWDSSVLHKINPIIEAFKELDKPCTTLEIARHISKTGRPVREKTVKKMLKKIRRLLLRKKDKSYILKEWKERYPDVSPSKKGNSKFEIITRSRLFNY